MHLPEFALLVLATIAAIAAGLAVLASKYSIARVLFWIAGISFWSLGILWSVSSEGYSLQTQLLVAGVVGAIAAVGLTWALWEIRLKEKVEQPAHSIPVAAAAEPVRRPTLEATRNSRIDATGAIIPGDLPFQFGKADDGSVIDMPGTVVTRRNDGSITIEPGKIPVNRTFPPPTGEFSDLSNSDLKDRAVALAADLRDFQNRFQAENRSLPRLLPPQFGVPDDIYKQFSEKYRSEYSTRFADQALSIASEIMARIENAAPGTRIQHSGAVTLYHKTFAGPRAALEVAEFLELLAHSEVKPN